MSRIHVHAIKCTHVVAQVSLGFYDSEGNLLREEVFPQSGGSPGLATLFHPHAVQLGKLIEMCLGQAWEKVAAEDAAEEQGPAGGSSSG